VKGWLFLIIVFIAGGYLWPKVKTVLHLP